MCISIPRYQFNYLNMSKGLFSKMFYIQRLFQIIMFMLFLICNHDNWQFCFHVPLDQLLC
jgi:hypothetical protein